MQSERDATAVGLQQGGWMLGGGRVFASWDVYMRWWWAIAIYIYRMRIHFIWRSGQCSLKYLKRESSVCDWGGEQYAVNYT